MRPFALASHFDAFVGSGALSGIATAGAAVVTLRAGVLPRWVGWAGASIAVAAIVGSAAIVENDPANVFAAANGLAWLAYVVDCCSGGIAGGRTTRPTENVTLANVYCIDSFTG